MPPKRKGGKSAAQLLEEKRRVFVPPAWSSSRPKPQVTADAWEPQTAEELARYIDWHGRHPHNTTPRKASEVLAVKGPNKLLRDEENPEMVYFPSQAYANKTPADFTPTMLGADGNFEDASVVATVYERQANLAGRVDSDDPWYTMSVKDRLEQYHIDGDHTTQKSKPKRPPPKSELQLKFERDQAWQKEQYGSYEGGGPAFEGAKRQIIEALSLANPVSKHEFKKKIGPWESDYEFTRFTKGGTNLLEFDQIEVEKRVEKALETFRAMSASKQEPVSKKKVADKLKNVMAAGMAGLFGGGGAPVAPREEEDSTAAGGEESAGDGDSVAGQESVDGGGGDDMSFLTMENATADFDDEEEDKKWKKDKDKDKDKKKKKKKPKTDFIDDLQLALDVVVEERDAQLRSEQELEEEEAKAAAPPPQDPDAGLGKYELMIKKIGGDEVCEKKAEEWIKFAAHVRKKAKRDQNLFDLSTDLYDCCNQGNFVKVLYILGVQQIDPNSVKTPEDEPLVIHMVNKIIALDDLSGSLHDSANETPDRVKLHRVLQALIKFGVDLTTLQGKGGLGAVHLAAQANNSKLLKFLCENGCNGRQWSKTQDPTVGPINCLNIAAKFGYVQVIATLLRLAVPIDTKDDIGRTALHWAGFYGQTRTSLFLLQCGADKRIMDSNGKSPGILAEEVGYVITGQTILTYTVPAFQSMTVLKYYAERLKKEDSEAEAAKNSFTSKLTGAINIESPNVQRLAKLGESFTAFVGSVIRGAMNLGRRAMGMSLPDNRPGSAAAPEQKVSFEASFKA